MTRQPENKESQTNAGEQPKPALGNSYRESLKATLLVGGSQIAALAIGVIRTKVMAVLLGPSGIALFGLYQSAMALVAALAGMGVNSSGARQIAEARGQDDEERIALTVITVRRISWILGFLGAAALFLLREPLSRLTFGNTDHASAIGLMSLVLWMQTIQGGLGAIIQGNRRIKDLAIQQILGAFCGVLVAVPIIILLGERGVAWSMLAMGAAGLATTWWFARRVRTPWIHLSWRAMKAETRGLLSLGVMLMGAGIMTTVVVYATNAMVTRMLGLTAMGLYGASTGLSWLYVGMVLQAMGADFYPHLTSVAHDNARCNRTVNEQAEVSILLAVPGVVATLVFAPLVLSIFYTSEFLGAAEILRWQILGISGRVITWPMAFIPLAKGAKKYFIAVETISNIAHIIFIALGIWLFGITGLGVALFALYLFYAIPSRWVAGRLSGFRWSKANQRHWFILFPTIAVAFGSTYLLNALWSMIAGGLLAVLVGIYSLKHLHDLVGAPGVGGTVRFILKRVPMLNRFKTARTW